MSGQVLLTGATGFLGRRLLRNWLQHSSAGLTLLVRSNHGSAPAMRFGIGQDDGDSVLFDAFRRRVTVVEADLTAPGLGLSGVARSELTRTITQIIHCAGLVRFNVPLNVARRTNTAGTGAMLDLARRCARLVRFDHISTAFVAGCRGGAVYENELECGQGHNNGYEKSKFEAEILVRQAGKQLPIVVYRPSIITCEARTGELPFRSAVGRMLGAYASGALTSLPGRPDTKLDLVPVEFVADAVFAISQREDAIGGCYHLAAGPGLSPTLAQVRDLAAVHFGRQPLAIVASKPQKDADEQTAAVDPASRKLRDEIALYEPYLNSRLLFDTTLASRMLQDTGIAVPKLADYFGTMAQVVARYAKRGRGFDRGSLGSSGGDVPRAAAGPPDRP
jgi:long-chain acyl-CoA synthetase